MRRKSGSEWRLTWRSHSKAMTDLEEDKKPEEERGEREAGGKGSRWRSRRR